MPTTRKRKSRKRKAPISPCAWAFLNDDPAADELDDSDGWELYFLRCSCNDGRAFYDTDVPTMWAENREAILRDWIEKNPGTRPACWWRFDAPRATDTDIPRLMPWQIKDGRIEVPRRRLGGIGTPAYEVLAFAVSLSNGIPNFWVRKFQVKNYGPDFDGRAIDPDNPPLFESEAAYLDRHGLFLPRERIALTDEDFEPEPITPSEPEE